jgi:hypothetical protein
LIQEDKLSDGDMTAIMERLKHLIYKIHTVKNDKIKDIYTYRIKKQKKKNYVTD